MVFFIKKYISFHKITCKNDLFPTKWDVFHSWDIVLTNEVSRLCGMIFFHVIASFRRGRPEMDA